MPSDTLLCLKQNIEQKSYNYTNRALNVLLDTLQVYGLKNLLYDYSRPHTSDDVPSQTYPGDTVKTRYNVIYFEPYYSSLKSDLHFINPNINTHIKWIYIEFAQPVPFPTSLRNNRQIGTLWQYVENICKPYLIYEVKVGE